MCALDGKNALKPKIKRLSNDEVHEPGNFGKKSAASKHYGVLYIAISELFISVIRLHAWSNTLISLSLSGKGLIYYAY